MIEGVPMEADAYIWGGVLGGCKIHGNVENAEIDVCWRSTEKTVGFIRSWWMCIRKLMNYRKVKNSVACSLIESEVDIVENF